MIEIYRNNSGIFQENTYFVKDTEALQCFIVDPGFYDSEAVKTISDTYSVKYIIATHTHMDHVNALDSYRQAFPDAEFMFCEADSGYGEKVSADRYIKDGDKLVFGDRTIEIIATPGHTPGGVCLLVDEYLFSGDTLFRVSVGRTDFAGGSTEALVDSIRNKLFKLPDSVKVFPGHGVETSIEFEKRVNPFV